MTFTRSLALAVISSFVPLGVSLALGNERHFTYTYESAVLPKDGREIEVWTTPGLGRDHFYSRFDERVEFEVGLTDRLQTSLYLNFGALTAETMPGMRQSSVEFQGISSEWKYKLRDPVADALGSALYAELLAGPTEVELEAKLIVDKRIGKVLLAANLVGELGLEFEEKATDPAGVVELDAAATYSVRPGLSLGLELRSHNQIMEEAWRTSVLFAGPVVAYAASSWWVALSVMPQLPALKKEGGGTFELAAHERFNARLLFSFHL